MRQPILHSGDLSTSPVSLVLPVRLLPQHMSQQAATLTVEQYHLYAPYKMRGHLQLTAFSVVTGDLLTLDVEAIVNPANITLQGRGGLSGQILKTGGPELLAACKALGLCQPGHAVITPGFGLHQHHVIHAVGPTWSGGQRREAEILAACYRAILSVAKDNHITRLGLPAISTGIFRYPVALATEIAVREMVNGSSEAGLTEVIFACFDDSMTKAYTNELQKYR